MSYARPTRTIGILTPHLGGVYNGSVIAQAHQEARRHGVRLIVVQESPGSVARSRLAWDLVDGWIVVSNTEGVELLAAAGVPIVTVSSMVPGLTAVLPDNYGGMYAAVSHLIAHGHQRIAFMGRLGNTDVKQRFQGYQAALAEHAIPFDERLVVDADDDREGGGASAARMLIESGVAYTALAAGTDKNAVGALEVVREAGYRVPDDVAIVGFDDVAQAQTADPPLTTVRQRFDLLASIAIDRLMAQISDRSIDPRPIYAATALITRRSCGCEAAQASLLVRASGSSGPADWHAVLAQQLIQHISYPMTPDPATPPTQVWPGMATLIAAIDCALADRDLPAAAAIEDAWREAIGLTADLDTLNTAFNLIEQVSTYQLAAAPQNAAAHARLTGALRLIRSELLRARVAHETTQVGYLDTILSTNNDISTDMLTTVNTTGLALDWLRHTPARWGCLSLWVDSSKQTDLALTSIYTRNGPAQPEVGSRVAASAFPPDTLHASGHEAGGIITMLPVRTSRRTWGVLAMDGFIHTSGMWNSDPIVTWSRMLGAALDRAALMNELNQQQEDLREQRAILQAAYDRERVLASTVREIGCPVIPLMRGVLLIPLIGVIDAERTQQIIKVGLDAVSRERATNMLIDVTGVPIVDTHVAGALIQMAQMVSLLGARTMLVGVRPEIAQSIVGLGVDLTQIRTYSSLEEAIRRLWSNRG
jgi:DNA-binding LacI/PurR family transcriptional regulator/anti-anti-sigma regulatory factor